MSELTAEHGYSREEAYFTEQNRRLLAELVQRASEKSSPLDDLKPPQSPTSSTEEAGKV